MELLNVELEQESILETLSELAVNVGISDEIKQALLQCFEHVAWVDDEGQTYYDALYDALYPPVDLSSISCVYTQSGTVYDTDSLDSLKPDLVVTAHYSDQSTEAVTTYTLSGTLTEGTSTITVSYGGKTTTFDVVVTEFVADPIYTDPLKMVKGGSGGSGAWDATTLTGYVVAGSASSWPSLLLNNLAYTYAEVANKTLHLSFDLAVTNMPSSLTGSGVITDIGVFTSRNPNALGSQRLANHGVDTKTANGTYHIEGDYVISELFTASGLDNGYLGFAVIINVNNYQARADVSNIVAEVY